MTDISYVRTEEAPSLPPPPSQQGITGWLWSNIFSSMSNFSTLGASVVSVLMIIMTVLFGLILLWLTWGFLDFTIFSAIWSDPEGLKGETCAVEGAGACWPYIYEWLYGITYGNEYPREDVWRVQIVYYMLAIGIVQLIFEDIKWRRIVGVIALLVIPFLIYLGTKFTAEEHAALLEAGKVDHVARSLYVIIGMFVSWVAVEFLLPVKRAYVGVFMLTLFPILTFVLLNGTPILDGQGFTIGDAWIPLLIGALLLGAGFAGQRKQFGEVMEAFAPMIIALGAILFGWGLIPTIAAIFDGAFGFEVVNTAKWGGLLVTLVVALTGIIFSLPLGILLALGRQSNAPLIKWVCIIFIEVVRGIPLISVLFFASVMLEYFLPEGVDFNKLLRALVGVALFASAYMAEVIRGGLQAMPKGQYEGGMSLGLSYWQQMRLIILPQALTTVIPGIVNTFIGLFKDTTLVLIISITDLLGMVQLRAGKDIEWYSPMHGPTGYVFVAIVFWVFCFGMSRYSIYMENKLHRGHR